MDNEYFNIKNIRHTRFLHVALQENLYNITESDKKTR